MNPSAATPKRIAPLEHTDFQRLEHAAYLKGLLQPFKGKGALATWANQCGALRDDLIALAQRRVLARARLHPFTLLPIQLAQQTTGAGTIFLRWRNLNRSRMGVALWQDLISNPATPASLIDDLYELEQQRVLLNMHISLTHTLARQAAECANKFALAEDAYLRRREQDANRPAPTRLTT
ncbi:DUF3158 family protein [Pseudomonas chlororaphis]|uniref:DUF3158 family protein n=1 Tax=Pseudomonas chlororaphis TaxID=587753 RepID=UPI000470E232|nr:DUF3158 family protein [Pseudomonas chlororaphis]